MSGSRRVWSGWIECFEEEGEEVELDWGWGIWVDATKGEDEVLERVEGLKRESISNTHIIIERESSPRVAIEFPSIS